MLRPRPTFKPVAWILGMLLTGMLFSVPQQATAQPVLTFTRIVNNWPTIELYFKVGCDGMPVYPDSKQFYKVFENGLEVGEFTIWCPDPRQRCAISVSLVFDASGSMYGAGNAGAKAAGLKFVELMDGIIDEAAIIWFSDNVEVRLGMTTNKTDLADAVNSLPVLGMTACWDGIYVGVTELILSGSNPCRAVIAMTDGGDNSSTHTPDEIIALANRNRVRIFTIGVGGVSPTQLQMIANLTGGQYYQAPSPSQLVQIYEEISTIIFGGFLECIITYEAKCQDGGTRTVDLTLFNYCHNGTDTKTRSYRAPKDTGTYLPLVIELGKGKGRGNSDVTIPLELVTPISPKDNFYPAVFTLLFDPDCVQFKAFTTPPGSLLFGVPVNVEPIDGGVKITTEEKFIVEGNGTLGEFTFKLSDPDDTTCCDLDLATWVFEAGCFKPILKDGEICIIPRAPEVTCQLQMPLELTWARNAKDYSPNPFNVKISVLNTGDKDAKNVRFKIDYDPNDFDLRSPISDIQPGFPVDVMVGQMSEATWNMYAVRRLTGDSVEICITAMMDNHKDVTCCDKMWIPPTEPILQCTIQEVQIRPNNDLQRYEPMPFDITVNVVNQGGMKTDTVYGTIIVPPDLVLYNPDAPDHNTKKVTPFFLLPNQSGYLTWRLYHPITLSQQEYVVQVWVKTKNADSSLCEVRVIIPPMDAPSLRASCITPATLTFSDALDAYTPNPFDITLTVINVGKMPADNVSAFLYLPANFELVSPPVQSLRADYGTLDAWKAGDPYQTFTWKVKWLKRFRYNTTAEFKWAVAGVGRTGIPTDTVYVTCETDIPGLKPSFACVLTAPDRIGLNVAETGNEPNPFTVSYQLTNTSKQTAAIKQLVCYYPNDGIALRSIPGNTQTRNVDITMTPGQQETFDWVFDVSGRINPRSIFIQIVAYDDEGNPVICEKTIPIDPLKTAMTCNVVSTESIIKYDQILQDYTNPTFTATATLFNAGGFNLSEIFAEMQIIGDFYNLLEFDGGYTGVNTPTQTYPVLFQGQDHSFTWAFKLKQPNMTGVPQFIELAVSYGATEVERIDNACSVIIQVDPVLIPRLVCSLKAPDRIVFDTDHYDPSIFDVQLRVENLGNGDARNVMAYVLQDERFTVAPGSTPARTLGSMPSAMVIDFGDNPGFQLKVKPRATDGYDTVTVVVVADGIPEAMCTYEIFVEAEKRPVFEMLCVPDAKLPLVFNEALNDYAPNPFEVTTTITNIGQTLAKDCEIIFVGPRKFEPYGQNSIQPFTTPNKELAVGDSWTFTWNMRALKQDVGSTENMIFAVRGKGGLGDELVIGECQVPILLPPARAARYEMVCTSPEKLRYDPSTSSYIPDPFVFTVNVKNTGQAEGMDIVVSPSFNGRIFLAPGQSSGLTIFRLPVGQDTTLTWLLSPVSEPYEETVVITASLKDRFLTEASCESETIVPEATKAVMALSCKPEFDALTVDTQKGDYLPRNPFDVEIMITNTSTTPINDVAVTLTSGHRDLIIVGDPTKMVAQILGAGQTAGPIKWQVKAKPRTETGTVTMQFRVTSSNVATQTCNISIYIPEIGRPRLDCIITRPTGEPDDDYILNFLTATGDYEGENSGLGYTYFTLNLNVMNVGEAMADQVRVRIAALDGGAVLIPGETPTKSLDEGDDVIVNGVGHASWKFMPIRQVADSLHRFEVTVTSNNAEIKTCIYDLTIEGAPKVVDVTLPDDAVGQFGDKIVVPVYVSPTIGCDVKIYKLNVQFDPAVVRFIDATNQGTQTQYGWNSPRAKLYSTGGSEDFNVVRIEDFTTGSALASKTDGILVYLIFEAVYGGDDMTKLDYATADLKFLLQFTGEGAILRSSMNSMADDQNGDIALNLIDGQVTVSGACIVPLNSSLKFQLAQNTPNPFNPSTVIEYTVGIDCRVKLDVYDALGRYLMTLVDENQKAGNYRRTFDASALPSGTYLYKLETPHYTDIKRMVLMR